MGEWNPLNKLFTLGGRIFNLSIRKQVLKRAESHRCEVNKLGILRCNFKMFLSVQNLNGVTDFNQENV